MVTNTTLRDVVGLRDQGVWQAKGLQLVPEQSLHSFRSKRRADAFQRSKELVVKLQVDKIELSRRLLEAERQLSSWHSWWDSCFEDTAHEENPACEAASVTEAIVTEAVEVDWDPALSTLSQHDLVDTGSTGSGKTDSQEISCGASPRLGHFHGIGTTSRKNGLT